MPRQSIIETDPRADEMVALRESGRSIASIAREFGVPEQSLKRYLRALARRSAASSVASAASSVATPVETFAAAFGVDPMEWQVGYLADPADTVVLKGRQVGATQAAAGLAIHVARSRGGADAVVISPSMRQSSEITVRARLGLDALGEKLVQDSAGLLRLRNGSRILSLPGNSRGIRGYAPALVIVDEAAWVADDTWTAARPLVSASGGRLIVQSTPGHAVGFFHALATDTPEGWSRLLVRSTDVPTIPPEFIERERREMTPALFAQEYLAEFADGDGLVGRLFNPDDIERAFAAGSEVDGLASEFPHLFRREA